MPRIHCPFCPHPHDVKGLRCPEQPDFPIPAQYVQDYRRSPPLWLMTFGFGQHGKTTYLTMLTATLELLANVMEGMWSWTLDEYSFRQLQEMRRELQEGKQASSTRVDAPIRPMFLQVNGMQNVPARCLVLYDLPGQILDQFEGLDRRAGTMKHVNTAWFLISLPDLLDDPRTMTDLFTVYLNGLRTLRVDPRGWNLIVVFTKADKYRFTPEIDEYLRSDPLTVIGNAQAGGHDLVDELDVDFDEYMVELERISAQLETFTQQKIDGGRAFVAAVRGNGMELRFCVTSALGQDPPEGGGVLPEKARPHRVLDPLLWALTVESTVHEPRISLVVDASTPAASIFENRRIEQVWSQLGERGEVTTFLMGQALPTAGAGQAPPKAPPETGRPRLIGPILDSAPASKADLVVVLTAGPILDLDEYDVEGLRERILVVKVGSDFRTTWTHCRVLREDDDPALILEAFPGLDN